MTKLAIAVNVDRCVGCHTCSISCKMSNNVPDGMLWNRVLTENSEVIDGAVGVYPALSRDYLPLACQHCENPACQKVCPTGATYKDDKGRVEIDYDKCIGCRMCMAACPYNARVFNWTEPVRSAGASYGEADVPVRPKGVMEKCTLCHERTDRGDAPMCVACCPARARVYGDLDDPNSDISKIAREKNVRILLEEMGTSPQVFYFG
ncbi:4Fe-4S dicluster domain-containing protein [Gordonibacter sp. Marseille-P4307]|uniref:4Fe-4S dicluster domain-containing protein n=1 Tax=Gordonibacter sp. Marseille-P4307 TaxID=2161815 RepID=UPI000F5273F4|nr:4Fe-4S dicluster domain-containing protein [Gordonibacter sp. Marseille-P4307]